MKAVLTIEEKQQRVLRGKRMTVRDLFKCTPLKFQSDKKGNPHIKKSQLKRIREGEGGIRQAMSTTGNPILVSKKKNGKIILICGHHRLVVCKEEIEAGDKSLLDFEFPYSQFQDDLTDEEMWRMAQRTNECNATNNWPVFAVSGVTEPSRCEVRPFYTAFLKLPKKFGISFKKMKLTVDRMCRLCALMGAIFHDKSGKNAVKVIKDGVVKDVIDYAKLLKEGKPVLIFGKTLYESKNRSTGNAKFYEGKEAYCDISDCGKQILAILLPAAQVIQRLREENIWQTCLGKKGLNTSFEYIIYGMAFRGELFYEVDKTMEEKRLNTKPFNYQCIKDAILKENLNIIQAQLQDFQNNSKNAETWFLGKFEESKKSIRGRKPVTHSIPDEDRPCLNG